MKTLNRKQWEEWWLRGVAVAVAGGRIPHTALASAVTRARNAGLTDQEISRLVPVTSQDGPPSGFQFGE